MLNMLGYQVKTAINGEEGIYIYLNEYRNIDLVIIDMIMPKIGGRECFLQLKKINPAVKAILSTGFSIDGRTQEILDDGVGGFIQKPYRIDQLSKIVSDVINK